MLVVLNMLHKAHIQPDHLVKQLLSHVVRVEQLFQLEQLVHLLSSDVDLADMSPAGPSGSTGPAIVLISHHYLIKQAY